MIGLGRLTIVAHILRLLRWVESHRHEPLGADVTIQPDQPVVVRFAGVSFRGKLLRKAKVEIAAG